MEVQKCCVMLTRPLLLEGGLGITRPFLLEEGLGITRPLLLEGGLGLTRPLLLEGGLGITRPLFPLEVGSGNETWRGSGNETMSMQAVDERPCSAVHN